jgi:hypothetical protein
MTLRRLKRSVTVLVALYAMALHVIVAGFAPIGAGTPDSAASLFPICHSVSLTTPDGDSPINPGLQPGQACDHCNLCSAAAPPPAPDAAFTALLAPTKVVAVLKPASLPVRDGRTADRKLARGPPAFA